MRIIILILRVGDDLVPIIDCRVSEGNSHKADLLTYDNRLIELYYKDSISASRHIDYLKSIRDNNKLFAKTYIPVVIDLDRFKVLAGCPEGVMIVN